MNTVMLLFLLVSVAVLAFSAPAAAQIPAERSEFYAQVDGGTKTKDDKRKAYGQLGYGSMPGMYVVTEWQQPNGEWRGRFKLYVDHFIVSGKTRLSLDKAGYHRVLEVNDGTRHCTGANGVLSGVGSIQENGTFTETLRGSWDCTGAFTPESPPRGKSRDFKEKLRLVPTAAGALIGISRGNLMNTKPALVYLAESDKRSKRCHFQYWDGAGNLDSSFPCSTPGRRFKPRDGDAQLTGEGDAEYRRAYATGPFKLKGKLDDTRRGKLKLLGKAFW